MSTRRSRLPSGGSARIRHAARHACGPRSTAAALPTYAFPLRDVARAYALLADPGGDPVDRILEARSRPALPKIRDAMLANPEMVGGRHDRLDTSLMKAAPDRLVSKSGMEALRGVAILPGSARRRPRRRGVGSGGQDRGRRRVRPRDVGGLGRGAAPGRRARRPGDALPRPLPPADRHVTRTAGSVPRRSPSSSSPRSAS